ncbi:MAG: hypothetical protein EA001_06710 [Oscillatoriales cyanobacterium]|nr:MAG: hypothetical protein EA001_06710 [Oscillatoriales cyanobacterium]
MDIRELSFRSLTPITAIPARRDRLRISGSPDPISTLYELARFCKTRLQQWVGCDQNQFTILYEDRGQPSAIAQCLASFRPRDGRSVEIGAIGQEAINLSQPNYEKYLLELCNYQFCKIFSAINPKAVQSWRKRIYSQKSPQIIQNLAEARCYLTFDFWRDAEDHLVLSLNFANDYRSLYTIDRLDLANFPARQRLIQTYDGNSCEWVGLATMTIGEPLPFLGNQSLLNYHCDRQNLRESDRRSLDPNQPAVLVKYPNRSDPSPHIPQLLKTIYDRSELKESDLKNLILPIQERYKSALAAMQAINRRSFFCGDRMEFATDLYSPVSLSHFATGARDRNLYFGTSVQRPDTKDCYTEIWQGWKARKLANKPDVVRAQLIFPKSWEQPARSYMNQLRKQLEQFQISLKSAGENRYYDPQNAISVRQSCQNLPDLDFVFAFIPDGQDREYNAQVNPYNTLKEQLNRQGIGSQMIARKTMNQPGSDGHYQNLVFGMLAKLGYTPWQLRSMPGTAQAFIGLDLGRKGDRTIGASAFVVDRAGQTIGWSSTVLQRGETFSKPSLRMILLDLFTEFQQQTGEPLRHLVVHRDGTLKNDELATLDTLAQELKASGLEQLDLVEIVKDTIVRAALRDRDPETGGDRWINPPRGWGWLHGENQAIVLTTGDKQKQNANATPRPLLVRRRRGETDVMILAEQVYWLSEMHIGSSQVTRLPITTHYADRIAEMALKGLLPLEVRHERRLYFI